MCGKHLDGYLLSNLALSIQPWRMTYFLRFLCNWCNLIATRYSTVISNPPPLQKSFPIVSVTDG